jgi:hypothetical protein
MGKDRIKRIIWKGTFGRIDAVRIGTLRALSEALGMRLELDLWRKGADLARLRNARHSALHEQLAAWLAGVPGWVSAPEVSFSIWGERGVIDRLGWHADAGALVVIELKSELADLEDLLGTMDRRVRLAPAIGAERGWGPGRGLPSKWVLVADTRTNRRRLAEHRSLLRSAFPDDGRSVRAWLREPSWPLSCLSFLPIDLAMTHSRRKRAAGEAVPGDFGPVRTEIVHESGRQRPAEPRPGVAFRG